MMTKETISPRALQILERLCQQDDWLSGERLCQELEISRNAIWKHIRQLQSAGYDIRSARRLGYRYVGFPEVLSQERFEAQLRTGQIGRPFHFSQRVDSTNRWAFDQAILGAPHGSLFVADCQTAGVGREHSQWFSPPGKNLYASILLRLPISCQIAEKVCWVATKVLAEVLCKMSGEAAILAQPPGDIMYQGRKFAGVMGLVCGDLASLDFMILGLGLLLNMREEEFPIAWRKKMISFSSFTSHPVKRQELMVEFCELFEKELDRLLTTQRKS